MNLTLRPGTSADTERCGTICYEAFKAIADRHQFPPDFSSPQAAVASTERRFSHASYYAVVAELEGRIVGSVFLDERSPIASVASITVDPAAQNRMIGRRLMEAVLQRVAERRCPGVRLIQAAYNTRSLSLYAKLGFEVREPLAAMQGPPLALHVPGYTVRGATKGDRGGTRRSSRRLRDRARVRGSCHGRRQRRPDGPDRRRFRVQWPRLPPADTQPSHVSLVPGSWPSYRAANDAHEHRPLQRAAGGILALDRLLKGLRLPREAVDYPHRSGCPRLRRSHRVLLPQTPDKRWVLVTPPGSTGVNLLLARASTPEQEAFIGRQTGGRAENDFVRNGGGV